MALFQGDFMNSGSGCAASEPFALRVLGDSMLPEFAEGAVIIIDPAGAIRDGCYVMAEYENEYIFRQLRIIDDRYYLQPLNDLYDTVEISGQEVIQGVITQKAGKYRKDHKHYGKD
jgi:SOS-response transcriptional repressor LexA